MAGNFTKLRNLLAELFMFEFAELDFGIYRIMNSKRAEIQRFLDQDLLPQVQAELGKVGSGERAEIETELAKSIQQAEALGADPDSLPKVKALRERLAAADDPAALEDEVFSLLAAFFRRYYKDGDYLALRRYKKDVYALPYEGEEVKLHWANADQYYIKSSEYFRDYVFKLPDGRRVHFKLSEADSEQNNNKAAGGKERRFVLVEQEPLVEEDDDLTIRFVYRIDPEKQATLNKAAAARILAVAEAGFATWLAGLQTKAPTEKDAGRTLLEKHLGDYTARNSFDYFIHKDLRGFLRRELDFFIKSEVMLLDDIEEATAPRVEHYLAKVRAMRRIAHKIIDMLAQLEEFQKRLWLKKKFVVETNYCVTLDRVPEELYPEIAANEAQREEWVRLFAIDAISGDLLKPGYSDPLTVEFLTANPFLVLDTRFFAPSFKARLLASFDDLDAQLDGLLVHSENFQALNLLQERYREQVRCIYIDPPYNTGDDGFLYKDNYQHSSWLSLISDRLVLSLDFLLEIGSLAVSIGQEEIALLRRLTDDIYSPENLVSLISVKRGSVTGHKVINPGVVNISEYVLIYAKNKNAWLFNDVYSERERDDRYNLYISNVNEHYSQWNLTPLREAFADFIGIPRNRLKDGLGSEFSDQLDNFVYEHAESVVQLATVNISGVGADFREAVVQSQVQKDVIVLHRRSGFPDVYLLNGKKILFYSDKVLRIGDRKITIERASDIWLDVLPNDLHNEGGVSLKKGKKPEALISRLLTMNSDEGDVVLDFFSGSGTTMAVAQKMHRKWVGIESAQYFDESTLVRLKNMLNGEQRGVSKAFSWQGGGFFKYIRLESYEDTLNNLEMQRSELQTRLLEHEPALREDYMLRYMLEVESRGSASLLNIAAFAHPFDYTLKIAAGSVGETRDTAVDLVETFNYLLGLRVRQIDTIRGVVTVQGLNPEGQRVLIIWRDVEKLPNAELDAFFQKQGYTTRDQEFDLIYVNGDNNLENLRRDDETWKVRLIEQEFQRLMFDVRDV